METQVLYQQCIEGVPKPTFEEATEVTADVQTKPAFGAGPGFVAAPGFGAAPGAVIPKVDADVETAARFAVQKYNKEQGTRLVFVRVVVGWKKNITVGTYYFIILQAKDSGVTKIYAAVVFKMAITGNMFLQLFAKVFG